MTNSDKQIVNCYEGLELSPEEICAQLSTQASPLDVTSIKQILLQNSSLYRSSIKQAARSGNRHPDDFTDAELGILRKRIMDLTTSEVPGVALKACTFAYNEIKGRNEVKKEGDITINNVKIINMRLANMRKAIARDTQQIAAPIVDVETVEPQLQEQVA